MRMNILKKKRQSWLHYLGQEWLLVTSLVGMIATSLYLKRKPSYSKAEIEVVFLLGVIFMVVKGLERSGLIGQISTIVENGSLGPLKLVAGTFFLSMIVTNDVALIITIPLTLSLRISRKDLLVILEALAANAGSALTPIGNPQNLFIYWYFHLHPLEFIQAIAPFSGFFLVTLIGITLFLSRKLKGKKSFSPESRPLINKYAYGYAILLIIVILVVLRIMPLGVVLGVVVLAVIFDRQSLRIDYGLLLTFLCFMGLAENIKFILASYLEHSSHMFILGAISSQLISNVPAALLLAKFTFHWRALLWGVSVGGFGHFFASLANLIAYKYYITSAPQDSLKSFSLKFLSLSYLMFLLGLGLYVFLY